LTTRPSHKAAKFHQRHVRSAAVVGATSKFESELEPDKESFCARSNDSSAGFSDEEEVAAVEVIAGSLIG
jgi:hypothetical protein